MSLTSYRAAPPRVEIEVSFFLPYWLGIQMKGALMRPGIPFGGPYRRERIFGERAFCRPGSDLLSRVLRRSTISAGAFHGRVRNGIGCSRSAITTRSAKRTFKSRSCSKRDPWDRRSAIHGIVVFVPFSGLAPLEAKLRKVDRPSALMRRTHVAPPEGRNKRE